MPRLPVYSQIIEDTKAAIARGELKPGDQLRTQDEFAADYGCSTTPVKFAWKLLEMEGVIETRQGVGAFVAGKREDQDA